MAEQSIADALGRGDFEYKSTTIIVPYYEAEDGTVQIVPNDEFYGYITSELQDLYLNLLIESAGGADNETD